MAKTCLVSLILVVMLAGCSKIIPKLDEVLPDKRTEYKKSKTLPDLEVPPDLTTAAIKDRMAIPSGGGETASFSTFQERAAERQRDLELERSESGAIKLLENEHILAVEGVPVQIWPRLREFWRSSGFALDLDDEELGVIETAWNENQEDLVRDKFKIFAEPGQEPGTTLLYISHRGEELVSQGDNSVWQPRARDIALERKVVERIQGQLGGVTDSGVAETKAPASETIPAQAGARRAELISAGSGKVYLTVAEDFAEAWKSTAAALSRAGIQIDQEDHDRGLYFIRLPNVEADQKKGVWSKLKFWGGENDKFQLSLTGVGDKTEVVVLNEEGKWETGDVAGQLLSRLNQELNAE
jgi:outer membrane protein assembly factor BamC